MLTEKKKRGKERRGTFFGECGNAYRIEGRLSKVEKATTRFRGVQYGWSSNHLWEKRKTEGRVRIRGFFFQSRYLMECMVKR